MKFSHALVIAVLLLAIRWYTNEGKKDNGVNAPFIFTLMLYLLLAAVFPWIAVPVGIVAVVWLLYNSSIVQQISGKKPAKQTGGT